ncbi:MAG: GxxExxY protein [Verrucomicrobiales bacterium]|nr:GxxExxY protein [Verrucomicrobiales bacterium]
MSKLIYEQESFQIRGACFEVYREKGAGFLESVYQECLELEMRQEDIPFVSQPKLELDYKGQKLKSEFQPDMICFGKIILELKAIRELTDEHRSQVHNYLRATGHRLGMLVNFGHQPKVEIERIAK